MYCEGLFRVTGVRPDWVFLALEKSSPHCAAAYKASFAFLQHGKRGFEVALRPLAECRERNEYPGLQPDGEWEALDLPPWVRPPGRVQWLVSDIIGKGGVFLRLFGWPSAKGRETMDR
jgi:hypothetical protein